MKEQNRLSFSQKFNIASGQFGCMLGAGIASGAVMVVFFIGQAGVWSPFVALAAFVLLFICYYFGIQMCRKYGIDSFDGLFKELFGKFGKVMGPVSQGLFLFAFFVSILTVYSGAGSFMNQLLGWPHLLGVVLTAGVCLFIALSRMAIFNKLQGAMGWAMFLILIVVYFVAIFGFGGERLADKFATGWMPEGASIGSSALWLIFFSASFISMLSVYMFNIKDFKTTRDVKQTLTIGFVLNIAATVLPIFALLAFIPEVLSVQIPTLFLMTDVLKFAPGLVVYAVLLIFAFLTTGGASIIAMNQSVVRFLPKKISNPKLRNLIVPIALTLVFIPMSTDTMMSIMYTYSPIIGYISIFVMMIPLLVIAPIKLRKKRLAEEAAGADLTP